MGRLAVMAMIESGCDRNVALLWHLTLNHFPPVGPEWIPCCEWVIDRAIAGECLDVFAPVPDGYAPQIARNVVEGLHLETWLKPTASCLSRTARAGA